MQQQRNICFNENKAGWKYIIGTSGEHTAPMRDVACKQSLLIWIMTVAMLPRFTAELFNIYLTS